MEKELPSIKSKNNNYTWPKIFIGSILLVIIISIAGILLLTLSYCLPISPTAQNVSSSSAQISKEGMHPYAELNNYETKLDNFTDALMINTAVFPLQNNPLVSAVSASRAVLNDESDPVASLESLVTGGGYSKSNYFRYWHGYLVPLKIFLYLGLDLQAIRYINFFIVLLLGGLIAVVAAKKKRLIALVPLLITCITTHIVVLEYSLQYLSVYVIALLAFLILISMKVYSPKKLALVFVVTGACTSYFDLLTAPLLTLGIPLCACLVLLLYEREKQILLTTIVCIVFWAGGYFGMWAMKIVIACLVLGPDSLNNALAAAQTRTDSSTYSWSDSIVNNLSHYHPHIALWVVGCIIPASILVWKSDDFNAERNEYIQLLASFLILSILPFVWMMILTNHSVIHNWMVYRIISISIAALSSALIIFVPKGVKFLKKLC